MILLNALRTATRRLEADFEDSKLYTHMGDRGEFREEIVGHFLQPFLPNCYGIGSGQIFSLDGRSSRQIDIVIYDSIFSNVLFSSKNNSLFPCESVFGTIEVKSNLTTEELLTSISNVISVKSLPRDDSSALDIVPFRRIHLGAGLTMGVGRRQNPYLGVIFGFDSIESQTLVSELNKYRREHNTPHDQLPDYIFSFRRQCLVLKARLDIPSGAIMPARFGEDFHEYVAYPLGDDILPLFFLTINTCLNAIILKAPDLNGYWIQVVNEALQRNQSSS